MSLRKGERTRAQPCPQGSPEGDSARRKMKIDIEKIAVILIAIFVAAIAVNHFRLVNARIEAARPCADQRR